MAITAPKKLSDFSGFLNREQSAPIFEQTAKASAIQQLAQQVTLGPSGTAIPVVTGKLSAGWVAEGGQKPASTSSMAIKNVDPKKLACIAVVSAEVVRANPGGFMDTIQPQIAEAFAQAFDAAAMHGTNSPFTTNLDTGSSAIELTGTKPAMTALYDDLNGGLRTLVAAKKRANGWLFDEIMEPEFNAAKDSQGRPLWLDNPLVDTNEIVRQGKLFSRRAFMAQGVHDATAAAAAQVFGYLGDWQQAAWGVVGGISYKVSTEASVTINGTLVSLFENNLVAIQAEAEYGWLVNDPASFARFINAA